MTSSVARDVQGRHRHVLQDSLRVGLAVERRRRDEDRGAEARVAELERAAVALDARAGSEQRRVRAV